MKTFFRNKILLISLFITVVSFFVYLPRISLSVFNADSGDFLAAILSNGVAHPPGYPLYLLLGRIFNSLPVVATSAWKVGLLSSLSMAFSSGILFYLCFILTKRIIPSIVASLSFAFLYSVWTYAEVTEAFALAVFFMTIILMVSYLSYQDFKTNKKSIKNLLLLCFVYGLALTHHHVVILFVPSLLFLFYPYRKYILTKDVLIKCLSVFFLGFCIYLYTYLSAVSKPFINWDNPINLSNFIQLITRADYGSFTLASFLKGQNFMERIFQIFPLLYFLYLDWSFIGIFIILIGVLRAKKLFGNFYWFLILSFILFGPFFVFYGALPISSDFLLGIFERFLIFSNVFLVPLFAVGLSFFASILIKKLPFKFPLTKRRTFLFLVEFVFILLPLAFFMRNSNRTNFSNFTLGDDLGKAIFESVSDQPKAILLLRGDANIFTTWYYVLSKYNTPPPSVALIPIDLILGEGTLASINKYYPWILFPNKEINNKTLSLENFVTTNIPNAPLFITSKISFSSNKYVLVPYGAVWEIVPKDTKSNMDEIKKKYVTFAKTTEFNEKQVSPKENFFVKDFLLQFSSMHLNYAQYFFENNKYSEAKVVIKNMQTLSSETPDIHFLLGKIFRREGNCKDADKELLIYMNINKSSFEVYDELIANAEECLKDDKKASEYQKLFEDIKATKERSLKEL